jgi:hypothetical protein
MRFSGEKKVEKNRKDVGILATQIYQPYSPLFEMGMGHKLHGILLALTSQHS